MEHGDSSQVRVLPQLRRAATLDFRALPCAPSEWRLASLGRRMQLQRFTCKSLVFLLLTPKTTTFQRDARGLSLFWIQHFKHFRPHKARPLKRVLLGQVTREVFAIKGTCLDSSDGFGVGGTCWHQARCEEQELVPCQACLRSSWRDVYADIKLFATIEAVRAGCPRISVGKVRSKKQL